MCGRGGASGGGAEDERLAPCRRSRRRLGGASRATYEGRDENAGKAHRREGADQDACEGDEAALTQKAPRQLLQPVVAAGLGVFQDAANVRGEPWLAPAI